MQRLRIGSRAQLRPPQRDGALLLEVFQAQAQFFHRTLGAYDLLFNGGKLQLGQQLPFLHRVAYVYKHFVHVFAAQLEGQRGGLHGHIGAGNALAPDEITPFNDGELERFLLIFAENGRASGNFFFRQQGAR